MRAESGEQVRFRVRPTVVARRLVVALGLMTIGVTVVWAQTTGSAPTSPGATPSSIAHVPQCLVSLADDREVAAQEAGPIVKVNIREGQYVAEGEVLAQIDDEQSQLQRFAAERELNAALEKAGDDINVRFAEASLEVADAELQQSTDINRRSPGSVPDAEIRRQELSRRRAELQIDSSKLEMRIAKMTAEIKEAEVRAADAGIRRRTVVSPVDGMVLELLRQEGEWVQAGQPVARVVALDRLYVEGFVSSRQYNPAELDGQRAIVVVELARGQRVELRGRVVFISPLVQGGDKLRVRVEADNRQENGHWILRPGMTAELMIAVK